MTDTIRQELEHYLSDNKNKPVIMDMVGRLLIEDRKNREQDQLNEEYNETAKIRCR